LAGWRGRAAILDLIAARDEFVFSAHLTLNRFPIPTPAAHLETILRRAHASGINIWSLRPILLWFSSAVPLENVQAGIMRLKRRRDRRSGMPTESRLTFYAKYASSLVRKHTALYRRWRMLERVCRKIEKEDPNRLYTERALLPCANETGEDWRLYTQTAAAETAVDRERRVAGKKAILSPAH